MPPQQNPEPQRRRQKPPRLESRLWLPGPKPLRNQPARERPRKHLGRQRRPCRPARRSRGLPASSGRRADLRTDSRSRIGSALSGNCSRKPPSANSARPGNLAASTAAVAADPARPRARHHGLRILKPRRAGLQPRLDCRPGPDRRRLAGFSRALAADSIIARADSSIRQRTA